MGWGPGFQVGRAFICSGLNRLVVSLVCVGPLPAVLKQKRTNPQPLNRPFIRLITGDTTRNPCELRQTLGFSNHQTKKRVQPAEPLKANSPSLTLRTVSTTSRPKPTPGRACFGPCRFLCLRSLPTPSCGRGWLGPGVPFLPGLRFRVWVRGVGGLWLFGLPPDPEPFVLFRAVA